jgi:hypothetical protein
MCRDALCGGAFSARSLSWASCGKGIEKPKNAFVYFAGEMKPFSGFDAVCANSIATGTNADKTVPPIELFMTAFYGKVTIYLKAARLSFVRRDSESARKGGAQTFLRPGRPAIRLTGAYGGT